jgi:serine/threonine protein phosphatase PrpC
VTFLETVFTTQSYRERCEDRVRVLNGDDRTVIVVADGAGGIGSGDIAADTVLREITSAYTEIHSADQWSALLKQIDFRITDGESTAVVIDIRPYGIAGSSVGDSCAMLIHSSSIVDLTKYQKRKPLLGSGKAEPTSFMHAEFNGILLAGTDGFFNYAKRDAITALVAQSDFYTIPRLCVEKVRLSSGDLWDDIGIVVARVKPKQTHRKRYSI